MKEITAYQCETCQKTWLQKELAERCCTGTIEEKNNTCRVCSVDVQYPYTICSSCKEKERYDKATKILYKDYKIVMFYSEIYDRYNSDIEDLFEYIDDNDNETPYPKWAFGCTERMFAIDIENAIENAEEDFYEDFEADNKAVDLDELLKFVDDWNKKQTAKCYEVDYKTVVLFEK